MSKLLFKDPSGYVARNSNVGKRFGRLLVIGDMRGAKLASCVCDCGTKKIVRLDSMKAGRVKSCGCWNREVLNAQRIYSTGTTKELKSEYNSWRKMLERCHDPESPRYHDWGGRGISVFQAWRDSFDAFVSYMGRKPSTKHSVDRIDNSKNYEPGNVRWATAKEQSSNRRSCRFYVFNGEQKNIKQWSEHVGLPYPTLKKRLDSGWGIELAIRTPVREQYRHVGTL